MKSPNETAGELRRIAAAVSKDRDAGRVKESLSVLVAAGNPAQEFRDKNDLEGYADYVGSITLAGPFKKDSSPGGRTFEVDGVIILGDAFPKALAEATGQDLEEAKWNDFHEVTVEVDWDYTRPEPSVGWGGGHTIEDFEVVAIDGLYLENPADRKAATSRFKDEVERREGEWARDQEDAAAEARAESRIDDWD
jgi:hypothetical protein